MLVDLSPLPQQAESENPQILARMRLAVTKVPVTSFADRNRTVYDRSWATIILDEAQDLRKAGKNFDAVMDLRQLCLFKVMLSGTIVVEGPMVLWYSFSRAFPLTFCPKGHLQCASGVASADVYGEGTKPAQGSPPGPQAPTPQGAPQAHGRSRGVFKYERRPQCKQFGGPRGHSQVAIADSESNETHNTVQFASPYWRELGAGWPGDHEWSAAVNDRASGSAHACKRDRAGRAGPQRTNGV